MQRKRQAEAPPVHESIRTLAYCLWEEAGCPSGQDLYFWTEAETRLTTETVPGQTASAPKAPKAAPKRKSAPASNGQAKRPPKAAEGKAAR